MTYIFLIRAARETVSKSFSEQYFPSLFAEKHKSVRTKKRLCCLHKKSRRSSDFSRPTVEYCERRKERETRSPPRERGKKKKNDFDREKQKKQNFSNRIRSCTLMEAALDGTNFGAAEAAGVVVDAESPSFSARGVMLILL
jgi:hypothetical protein